MRKAIVHVRLKPDVLDPQGEAVGRALKKLGLEGIHSVRIGKLIELEVTPPSEAAGGLEALRAELSRAADCLLANPVMEEFDIVLD